MKRRELKRDSKQQAKILHERIVSFSFGKKRGNGLQQHEQHEQLSLQPEYSTRAQSQSQFQQKQKHLDSSQAKLQQLQISSFNPPNSGAMYTPVCGPFSVSSNFKDLRKPKIESFAN